MVDFGPLIYEPSKSINVQESTIKFLESNEEIRSKISELGWCYNSISKAIPQTSENFWSGHFFPYIESTEELQISINLAMFGFYKQAFSSLRCALEVGMLSVYYNINDEGQDVVQDWLKSRDTWEANTPRAKKIWQILSTNKNIKEFDAKFGLQDDFESLSYLHNYVHTKGYKFSNYLGKIKSNWQTFESDIFVKWSEAYEKVVKLLIKLHILKYPITMIEYEWGRKTGIDNPYPVLDICEVSRVKNLLSRDELIEIEKISENDTFTQDLFEHIKSLPDMTEEEIEDQMFEMDKSIIEMGQGFLEWEESQLKILAHFNNQDDKKSLMRIERVRVWAEANNMMLSKFERLKST